MSVSRIEKIQLTVVQNEYEKILDRLHAGGYMEIEEWESLTDVERYKPESKAEYWFTNVQFALDLLTPYYVEPKKSLAEKLGPSIHEVTQKEVDDLLKHFEYKKLIAELENLDKQHNDLKNAISNARRDVRTLENWKGLPQIDSLRTQYVTFAIGTISIARFDDFKKGADELKRLEIVRISESDKEVRVIVAYVNDIEERVRELFELQDFKESDLDLNHAKTIEDRVHDLTRLIDQDSTRMQQLEDRIQEYTEYIPQFQMLYDYLSWRSEQDEVSRNGMSTKDTVTLIGWIQSHRMDELKQELDDITSEYILEEAEVGEDEERPVALRNSTLITPFESVTEIYGAPQYNEPDPTIYLAPFFIVYFGLSLTDAGYGLLLSLFAYLGLKFMKPKGGARKIMRLMVFGGIATFILGAAFGGWFGIVLDDLPAGSLKDFFLAMRLIDPVANPMSVLILSFILGFIQMVVGNVIDAAWKIRHGQAKDGLLGSGMWALFLLIIGFWIAALAGTLPESITPFATYLLYAGIAGMVLTQGRDGKNIFVKAGKGIFSLYGLVGYLSDILSYSRLLALGLSTGIIAMVVNLVAGLFAGMVPAWIGWLVWIVIIIGGHMFNLAINVLGAFIHAGRLQFVEYFPKFLVGGGRKFKPLIRTSKYINISAKGGSS